MQFRELSIPGVFSIEPELRRDERGFFARVWCAEELRQHGLDDRMSQSSISFTERRATLRGLHYQAAPHDEVKIVRCTRGAIFDVAVDLRPESATYCRWVSEELSADNHRMMYIPVGFAHGFVTLTDDCEVVYQMSVPFAG